MDRQRTEKLETPCTHLVAGSVCNIHLHSAVKTFANVVAGGGFAVFQSTSDAVSLALGAIVDGSPVSYSAPFINARVSTASGSSNDHDTDTVADKPAKTSTLAQSCRSE